MIQRLLIANRGEIAVRIARTARALGIEVIAVHSDVDADALHVAVADRAVSLGGARPEDSYLRGDAILAAAKAADADAIHPGYGFLSENAGFAAAVEEAGLIWVGPPPSAIEAMGDKAAAKSLVAAAGVPVVPGYHGPDQSPDRLAHEADATGYPLLIKAVAGGGGKGMRAVHRAEDFAEALAAAQGEARAAFGEDAVLLERLVQAPRHIEVQILGDGHRAIHLFERECSLQRRHQKVIEEAPAPGMTDAFRAAVTEAAIRAAEAVGYRGAGTVEFIADGTGALDPDQVYFMEMNTRLQVEHPVTEAVTGRNLVALQLSLAQGEPLPAQDEIRLQGHAIEARLYAEDPANEFLPAIGEITHLVWPEGIRVDTGIRAGDTVSPYYDPMIAKLITDGATRAEALAKMRRALRKLELLGLKTNQAFLAALCGDEDVVAGPVPTTFIADRGAALTQEAAPTAEDWALAATGALGLLARPRSDAFSLWSPLRWSVDLARDGEVGQVCLTPADGDVWEAETPLGPARVACWPKQWKLDGDVRREVSVVIAGAQVAVFDNAPLVFDVLDPLSKGGAEAGQAGAVLAPMPGLVVEVLVCAGDVVEPGAPLAIMEAMKMQHTLRANAPARVVAAPVAAGAQIAAGAEVVLLEPLEDG